MQVARNQVVVFHYEMKNESGEVLGSSRAGDPVAVLYGRGGLVRGVDDALQGRNVGELVDVTVPPELGYGLRDERLVLRISKKHVRAPKRPQPGGPAQIDTPQGPRVATVLKVGSKMLDVDLNHPLAGKTLQFHLEVVEVRAPTEEELAHGHAHGPDGHAHH